MSAQVHPLDDETDDQLFGRVSTLEEKKAKILSGANSKLDEDAQKQLTKMEEEIAWVMENIEGRMRALRTDEVFELHKWLLFSLATLSGLVGATFILRGLAITPLFDRYHFQIGFLVASAPWFIPVCIWFKYLWFPPSEEKKKRHRMRWDRRDRRKKNFFNDLVEDARKANEDPPRKIRILAHIRKHDIPIVCTTWRQFCEILENNAGIPIERQLIRYKDDDLNIDLRKNLYDPEYGLTDNNRLHIYCKGGYFTQQSPIRKQYEQIRFEENKAAFEYVDPGYNPHEKEPNVFDYTKSVLKFLGTRGRSASSKSRLGSRGSTRGGTAGAPTPSNISINGDTASFALSMNGGGSTAASLNMLENGSMVSSMANATRGSDSIAGQSSMKSFQSGRPGTDISASKKVSFR